MATSRHGAVVLAMLALHLAAAGATHAADSCGTGQASTATGCACTLGYGFSIPSSTCK